MFRCWPKRAALASWLSRLDPPAPPRRYYSKSWDERARRRPGSVRGYGSASGAGNVRQDPEAGDRPVHEG